MSKLLRWIWPALAIVHFVASSSAAARSLEVETNRRDACGSTDGVLWSYSQLDGRSADLRLLCVQWGEEFYRIQARVRVPSGDWVDVGEPVTFGGSGGTTSAEDATRVLFFTQHTSSPVYTFPAPWFRGVIVWDTGVWMYDDARAPHVDSALGLRKVLVPTEEGHRRYCMVWTAPSGPDESRLVSECTPEAWLGTGSALSIDAVALEGKNLQIVWSRLKTTGGWQSFLSQSHGGAWETLKIEVDKQIRAAFHASGELWMLTGEADARTWQILRLNRDGTADPIGRFLAPPRDAILKVGASPARGGRSYILTQRQGSRKVTVRAFGGPGERLRASTILRFKQPILLHSAVIFDGRLCISFAEQDRMTSANATEFRMAAVRTACFAVPGA